MGEDLERVDAPSDEVVSIKSKDALAELLAGMREAPSRTAEESMAVRVSIIKQFLGAETEEKLWEELPTWSSKTSVGVSFEIRDVAAHRSKYTEADGTKGGFFSCEAVNLDTGEIGIFNSSAMRICGRIGWYYLNDQLPVKLRVEQIGESDNGYPILDVTRIEAPVVAGKSR